MLDIKLIRENPKLVKDTLRKRGMDEKDVDVLLNLDKDWRELKQANDNLRASRNKISEKINEAKKQKNEKEAEKLIKEAQEIPVKIQENEKKLLELEEKRKEVLLNLPNLLEDDVPLGKDETENKEIKKVGKPKKFNFEPKHHQDILTALDCLDTEQGAKVAGARFYYLKNQIVKLNQALQAFALDLLTRRGFTPMQPPYMLNLNAMSGAVHISAFQDAIYKIQDEDLYLIGTAEHPLVAYMRDKIIDGKGLPVRFVGISPCFRREAGTHGKDTKGIFRVHQFEKIEQVVICKKEQAKKEFDLLLKNLEDIFKTLNIPYRLVILCSGDTGKKDAKTIDLEGWFPAQKAYRELGSCSTLKDFQGRRSNIRYMEKGETIIADTLNNTAIATERAIACLVENFQQKDGSIKIPKALWKYTGFKEIKAKKPEKTKKEKKEKAIKNKKPKKIKSKKRKQ